MKICRQIPVLPLGLACLPSWTISGGGGEDCGHNPKKRINIKKQPLTQAECSMNSPSSLVVVSLVSVNIMISLVTYMT